MENIDEKKIIDAKKYNAKLFPIYKMFSWDLLFYYSISYLFLTQAKGFTASNILFADSFIPIFKLLFQVPCNTLISKIGKRKSIIIGNIFVTINIVIVIFSKSINHIILSNAVMGFGYVLKSICETPMLNDCVTLKENNPKQFSKLDSKGSAYWFYFDAITSAFCGFLFVFNNYLPMCLCLSMCVVSTVLSYKFIPYESKENIHNDNNLKSYTKGLKDAFKHIFTSNRLKALLLFSGTFSAMLAVRSTVANSYYTEIGIEEQYFGIIAAILTAISGISSKYENYFHDKYKNTLLTRFSLTYSIFWIAIGLVAMIFNNNSIIVTVSLILFAIQHVIKGPYYTLIKRYLNNFSTPTMVTKIYAANSVVECLFGTIAYWFAAFLMNFALPSVTLIILGCVFSIAFIFILDYMKPRVGLKPEEYSKSDIYYTEVH